MSLFNLNVTLKPKEVTHHPWEGTIKDVYSNKIKWTHNSINNPNYPRNKEMKPCQNRIKFSVIGNRVTKEFMYCVNLVKGLHKYRNKTFGAPAIRGVTSVEWPSVWNDLKFKYGGMAYCLTSQVAVLYNDNILGGEKELKELIENKYVYNLCLNYEKESVAQFAGFVKSSGRPCVYLHISINGEHTGTLIFMLYADIAPRTCDNFCRLCKTSKGGYAGTPVHRIITDGWIQCGGFALKSTDLDCENFIVPHDRRGVLCMANDGRHIDCSTQFFVLLQPAPWMANKYVAFGQLIDGESTLLKIESVPTWYESPKSKIIIHTAGILNLECQDIKINPFANEHIQGHIEDLVIIGQLFTEMLLENVFLEIEFKRIQSLEQPSEGEGGDIHATQRFMRKKDEIHRQLEKSIMDSHRPSSGVSRGSKSMSRDDNQQFDVDEYTYVPEEYSYQQRSPSASLPPREERLFYIPLTDVPYPGEVDSIYDLKKFLKGDYCMESDLANIPKKKTQKAEKQASSYLMCDAFSLTGKSLDDESVNEDLDSDDEREVQIYLARNVDRVSFAGGVVKSIAKTYNLFENTSKQDQITDEGLRRIRLASVDMRQQQREPTDKDQTSFEPVKSKPRQTAFSVGTKHPDEDVKDITESPVLSNKVRITDDEQQDIDHEQHFKRRPTTFVRPGAFKFVIKDDDDDDDDDDHDEDQHKVHIAETAHEGYHYANFHRRPTMFVRPGAYVDDEDDDKGDNLDDDGHYDIIDVGKRDHSKVMIEEPPEHHQEFHRRPTAFVSPGAYSFDDDEDDNGVGAGVVKADRRKDSKPLPKNETRPSVLARLYEEHNTNEVGPTLKNYKPLNEMQQNNILLTHSRDSREKLALDNDTRDKFMRPSMQLNDSYDNVLNLQHGRNVTRKISTDYVVYVDQGRTTEYSIRSVEYARTRPSMTVSEYQAQNQMYLEDRKHLSTTSHTSHVSHASHTSRVSRTSKTSHASHVHDKDGQKSEIEIQRDRSMHLVRCPVSSERLQLHSPLHTHDTGYQYSSSDYKSSSSMKKHGNGHGLRLPGDSPLYQESKTSFTPHALHFDV